MKPEPSAPRTKARWRAVPTSWIDAQRRERDALRRELTQVRGMIPLLMKVRNGGHWSSVERTELMGQLRAIAHLSPYLVVLIMPGSFVALPALAWWLDRRRMSRNRAVE